MPYAQAYELLKLPDSQLADLLEAFGEMAMEYGYIAGTASSGIRTDAETDLIRTFVLMQALEKRILSIYAGSEKL